MNIPIGTGVSTFAPGQTPFGFYDNQQDFRVDSNKVADFCARRLGFPLADVELQSGSFFTAFEEAVTTYGNELYAYKVRENYLYLEGSSTLVESNEKIISPNMAGVVRISEQYGEEAGVGGTVTWYTGKLPLISNQQDYDMNAWAKENVLNLADDDGIELKRIFYEAPPAITRYFDPYAGTGTGMIDLMDSFGWGSYSPAINFLMMPLNYDMQVIQAIEMNDTIRRSNFTFELVNNQLKVFPIPTDSAKIWFEYIVENDRNNPLKTNSSLITDFSNATYNNMTYTEINHAGKQWIRKYTLALAKELLGSIRSKYGSIPIPGGETNLDGDTLRNEATTEKENLLTQLREDLEATSRRNMLERQKDEAEFMNDTLNRIPYPIYIG